MLFAKRSPGPPWLPIPHFADRATLCFGGFTAGQSSFVAALALVDRSFTVLGSTPWTVDGSFGLVLGAASVGVPNGAEWWAVSIGFIERRPSLSFRRGDLFRVRWSLHL